ncbi:MAG: hypothetical protein J7623_23090 [Chitinophaga sp.]|uniref:hypothetical protein n=1 Tax=Chitinophaga sp. TaxID=1869181 RepID=UPI001B06724E|nr:hypothetical protein [Chitinophaga sp.]MBO9731545.1 hypothetical protein [Chitinophaga sp.]
MSDFHIQLQGHDIGVTRQEENIFIVRLPEKTIHLRRKQDNEGASHWFEEGKDNETPQTEAIGTAITTWLAQHSE